MVILFGQNDSRTLYQTKLPFLGEHTLDDIEQTSESLEVAQTAPETPKKAPSKFGLFLRKLLRWTTGALAIFALGVVLMWIVQVRPKVNDVRELEERIEQLEGELDALNKAEAENVILRASLDDTKNHLSLLDILVDVSSAQLAINDGNIETAQAALAETDAKFELLVDNLSSDQKETLEAMRNRLSLALGEITEDAFATQSDLEVLRNSILALERSLFGD